MPAIKPELSEKSKYWVPKHRYYELKHFCLQYPSWMKIYSDIEMLRGSNYSHTTSKSNMHSDPTFNLAERRLLYLDNIRLVEQAAWHADKELSSYILKAVTEGHSYNYMSSRLGMPCSRDTYYDRYRKFFWLLSKTRN